MFTSKSESLFDFFNYAGVAYYIPYYQRQYSWDVENVEKMLDDLSDGVRKVCTEDDYVRFIGSIILWEEKQPKIGVHFDSNGLITKIYNVIDGQQRISTISVLAILISRRLNQIGEQIKAKSLGQHDVFIDSIVNGIDNRILELREVYSTSINKANVSPKMKPIIIRAINGACNPVVDQWTLKGNCGDYYKSDIGRLIAEFISSESINTEAIQNSKLKENIKRIDKWLDEIEQNEKESLDVSLLLQQNDKGLNCLIDQTMLISDIEQLDIESQELVCGAVRILAIVSFLLRKTYLTVIESPTESLAFDMFQSINATGTPLTAIEVFKPQVVHSMGEHYGNSQVKIYLDLADTFFDQQTKSAAKEKLTDDLLRGMALVFDGKELGRRFSEQRDWLTYSYNQCETVPQKEDFIHWLSDLTSYWTHIVITRRPKLAASSFKLVTHLTQLGLDSGNADLAALCIFYLKDAKHMMAHYLLSLFYSKLLKAQNSKNVQHAATEFLLVCKACAAFFTLWSSSLSGFPDQIYRELFNGKKANISWIKGTDNQTSAFVKEHFKQALNDKKVFDIHCVENSKKLWISNTTARLGYGMNRKVCRFALFVTSHDKAPDKTPGNEGLMNRGTPGSSHYLTCKAWYSPDYEHIEHIANQTKPQNPQYPLDDNLYPGNSSVIDIIGNLTLLSKTANASIHNEWAEKVFYYSTLTSLEPTNSVDLKNLAEKQGIKSIPPKLAQLATSTNYISNLAPLALRGNAGLAWNKTFVDKRTVRICELLFDDMISWL